MVSRLIPPEASAQGAPGIVFPFPAQVKGLNTRDLFTQLDPSEAQALQNWLPDAGYCSVRPGYESFASVSSSPVLTLASCTIGSTAALIAASGGSIYNVASGTAVSLASGYTGNYWHTTFLGGYLFGVNGTDTPWSYNSGGFNASTGFSGLSLNTITTLNTANFRLWATAAHSGDVWYGQPEAVTGPLTLFQVSQISDGGTCLGVFEWTAQQATVMCMSTGQVLVYTGDPTLNISLASKHYAPPLVEANAAVKMGGELILITKSGPISMDLVAAGMGFNLAALGDWGKIAPSWQNDVFQYGSNSGWFGKFINGLVYFNVPIGPTSKQYVFNTRNQAWTTYANLPLECLESFGGNIYFGGSDGNVYQHAGSSDNGSPIVSLALPGFSYLNDPAHAKFVSAMRPNIFSSGSVTGQFQIDTDFVASPVISPSVTVSAGGSTHPWGSAWGQPWGTAVVNSPAWIGRAAFGRALRPVAQTYAVASDAKWYSTDLLVQGASVFS